MASVSSNDIKVENCSCPVCSSTSFDIVYKDVMDNLYDLPGRFDFVSCKNCGQLYLNPRPTKEFISIYYPANYESFVFKKLDEVSKLKRISINYGLYKRCRLVLTYRSHGRLLDIGCGSGQFLDAMRKRPGWSVAGIDTSPIAVSAARELLGLEVYRSDIDSAPFPPASFDVVTMWDVFEHLYDPLHALETIRNLLKPDGVLIIRTPSLDSWDAALFGRCWAGLDPPRHLAVFSRSTLYRVLQRGGFRILKQHAGGGGYAILLLSLRIAWGHRTQWSRLRRLLWRLLEHPVAAACFALPLWLLERSGKGAEMCFVATPRESTM